MNVVCVEGKENYHKWEKMNKYIYPHLRTSPHELWAVKIDDATWNVSRSSLFQQKGHGGSCGTRHRVHGSNGDSVCLNLIYIPLEARDAR